jgi:hypothetical protein
MAARACVFLTLVALGGCVDLSHPWLLESDAAADAQRAPSPDRPPGDEKPLDPPDAPRDLLEQPDAPRAPDAPSPDASGPDQQRPDAPREAGPSDAGGCASDSDCETGSSCIAQVCDRLPDLALHWKLDETTGTQAQDDSGSGYHGTYAGVSAIPASSPSVPVLQFPDPASRSFVAASRQEVRLSSLPALLRRDNDVTLTAWFRGTEITDRSGYADIVSVGDGYILYIGRSTLGFIKRLVNRNYVFCSFSTTGHLDGRWHHLAGFTSAAGMRFFLDGTERCFVAQGGPVTYASSPVVLVGHDPDPSYGWYLDGNVDDVRVYTRVLSAAEILKLAAGGR